MPIAYKTVVDLLTGSASGESVAGLSVFGLAAIPAMLIIAYGVGRVLMVLFAQLRDVWFTVVAQNAVRHSPTGPSAICMSSRCAFIWSVALEA